MVHPKMAISMNLRFGVLKASIIGLFLGGIRDFLNTRLSDNLLRIINEMITRMAEKRNGILQPHSLKSSSDNDTFNSAMRHREKRMAPYPVICMKLE